MVNGISDGRVSAVFERSASLAKAPRAAVLERLPSQEQTPITDEQIKQKLIETTEAMNNFLGPLQTSLKFEMHEGLQEFYVSIVDDSTGNVLKEIPSKRLLDMYASMAENMALFVDKRI